jgi:hypothetical protein
VQPVGVSLLQRVHGRPVAPRDPTRPRVATPGDD